MNIRDSEIVRGMLEEERYEFLENCEKADIVIFNTCSVREHAEHRAMSILGSIARKKPRRIFGLIGCVAQHRKESLFKSIPKLDFICGPSDIYRIPEILSKIQNSNTTKSKINPKCKIRNLTAVDRAPRPIKDVNPSYRESKMHAYVNIMYGCNNFCSYCIVPYVRGREVSRPVDDILREIEELVAKGIIEITLLGQNVNSYKSGLSTKKYNFAHLLKLVNDISGIEKISFMTSHPKDASLELFKAMRDLDKIDKRLHLPLQSGSNRILKLMNRGYVVEKYKELAHEYRNLVPNARLTTDIIVGFPSEKEEDFDKTKQIMQDSRFDGAYIFKYSPRPPAKSHLMEDDVRQEIKKRRHKVLLELQKSFSREKKLEEIPI